MAESLERTGQLREYELQPGSLDRFVSFWSENLVPVREEFGFRVEWYLPDPEGSSFTWFVSAPGDVDAFRAREVEYNGSPQRAAVFERLDADPVERVRSRIVVPHTETDGPR